MQKIEGKCEEKSTHARKHVSRELNRVKAYKYEL